MTKRGALSEQSDPAVILSNDVAEPTTYQGCQVIELDFPLEYFNPPPSPPAEDEPNVYERMAEAMYRLARLTKAVAADLATQVPAVAEDKRTGLQATVDSVTNNWAAEFTAAADRISESTATAAADLDVVITAGGFCLVRVGFESTNAGIGEPASVNQVSAQLDVLKSLAAELRAAAPAVPDPGPDGTSPAITYSDDVPLLGDRSPVRSPLRALPETEILQAYEVAQTTGFFSKRVFPGIRAGQDGFGLPAIQEALKDLKGQTVVTHLRAGNRLVVYRDTSGRVSYRFIPEPVGRSASLLLVEYYRLSSFPRRYGVGRTIKTFSLLPGEASKIRMSSYKRTSATRSQSSSILDATTQDTESEFERSLVAEQSAQDATSRGLEYYADAQASAKASWGWGSASLSGKAGVRGTSNSSREEFAKNVSNAVAKNAARASSRRDMQINAESSVTDENGSEEAIERELKNINVSRTLNFVFRQMNQEYVSLLHLVDVRVAFFNGYAESRHELPLPELDRLLKTYIKEEHWTTVKDAITAELAELTDHTGTPRPDFVQTVERTGYSHLRVNPDLTSTYVRPGDPEGIEVPGVIIAADTHVLRTDGVVVDTFLGRGTGLDDYSAGLQTEAIRAKRLENDREQVELDRQRLALELLRNGDSEAIAMYRALFPAPQAAGQANKPAIDANGVSPALP